MDYRVESTYKDTRLPVELASTLVPDAYRSEEFFAEEQEQVFAKGWVPVAAISDVAEPGQTIIRTVAGRSVIITMNDDRQLRAFLNVCRHRGSRLVREDCQLRANKIRCPYHAWAYDLDGACIGTPMFEGSPIPEDMQPAFDMSDVKAFDKADYSLFDVKVVGWGPLILVSLDPGVAPIGEWVGDLEKRLAGYDLASWKVVATKDYDIAANWKLIAENFMEYYHLPWVHPELMKVSRIQDHYRWQGTGMYTGMTTTPISGDQNSSWLEMPPHSGVSGSDEVSGRFVLLFPNVAVNVLPNHCFIMIMDPISAGRTMERTLTLTHPETADAEGFEQGLANTLAFWDEVNLEDIEIVEDVQRGLSTPEYQGGRMCYRFEEPVHRFQNMIIDRMVGIHRVPQGDEEDQVPMFGV